MSCTVPPASSLLSAATKSKSAPSREPRHQSWAWDHVEAFKWTEKKKDNHTASVHGVSSRCQFTAVRGNRKMGQTLGSAVCLHCYDAWLGTCAVKIGQDFLKAFFFVCCLEPFQPFINFSMCHVVLISVLNQLPAANFGRFHSFCLKKSRYSELFNSSAIPLRSVHVLWSRTIVQELLCACSNHHLAIANVLYCVSSYSSRLPSNFEAFTSWLSLVYCNSNVTRLEVFSLEQWLAWR